MYFFSGVNKRFHLLSVIFFMAAYAAVISIVELYNFFSWNVFDRLGIGEVSEVTDCLFQVRV